MKKLLNVLLTLTAVVLAASGCVKQAEGNLTKPTGPAADFDWKTTKTIPVNIVAENDEVIPVFIYNGNERIASGFTPFNETITVPTSCVQLKAAPGPLPFSEYEENGNRSGSASGEDGISVVKFTPGDTRTLTLQKTVDWHAYLYKEWSSINKMGYPWEWFVNSWWNSAGGSPQYKSLITLYANRRPVYDAQGNVKDIPHTCYTEGCPYNVNADSGDIMEEEFTVSSSSGVYVFEDLFPYMGDYDMNDFVVTEFKSLNVLTNNKIKSAQLKYTVEAAGSSKAIAMAVRLFGVKQKDLKSITITKLDENLEAQPYECTNTTNLFKIAANKLEESAIDSEVVIPIFENFFDLIPQSAKGYGFNTLNTPVGGKGEPVEFIIDIEFDKTNSNIKLSDFASDVFIMPRDASKTDVEAQRGTEIHVADAGYTSKMNTSLFKTGNDASEFPSRCFRASNGYVWAIYLPVNSFYYPLETVNLNVAYPQFSNWIETSGKDYQNWYINSAPGKTWNPNW